MPKSRRRWRGSQLFPCLCHQHQRKMTWNQSAIENISQKLSWQIHHQEIRSRTSLRKNRTFRPLHCGRFWKWSPSIGAKGPGAPPEALRQLSGTIFAPESYRTATVGSPGLFFFVPEKYYCPVRFYFVRQEFVPECYRRLHVKNINPTGTLPAKIKSYRTSSVQIFVRPGVLFLLFLQKIQVLSLKSKKLRELRRFLNLVFFQDLYYQRDL